MASSLRIIDVYGSPLERGRQTGSQLKTLIREQLDAWLASLCSSHALDSPDEYISSFLKETNHVPAIEKHAAGLMDEVRGISEGAEVPFDHVLALNLMDEEWDYGKKWDRDHAKTLPPGCSVAGFHSSSAKTSYLAQTMDIPSSHDGSQVVIRHHPDKGPETIVFTTAGLLVLMGANESLACVVNNLSMLPSSESGLPVAFVIRRILEHTELKTASDFVRSVPHATGQHYALASSSGLVSLEAHAKGVDIVDGEKVLHTNHPLTDGAKGCASDHADLSFSGPRLSVLEKASAEFTSELSIMSVLKDTSAPISREKTGSWMTFGSLVAAASDQGMRVWVAPGPPHLLEFEEVPFISHANGPPSSQDSEQTLTQITIPNLPPILVSHLETSSRSVLSGPAGSKGDETGLMLWSAGSAALLSYLASDRFWELLGTGKKVVELGCGTGLVSAGLGLLAKQRGRILDVKATDGHGPAVLNAARTLKANHLPENAGVWSWSAAEPVSECDIVVASEIVYPSSTPESLASLFGHIAGFFNRGGIAMILSYVQRRASTTLRMLEALFHAGLSISRVPWIEYTTTEPALGAAVFFVIPRTDDAEFEEMLLEAFPKLREELAAVERTEEMLKEETEGFVLPCFEDEDDG